MKVVVANSRVLSVIACLFSSFPFQIGPLPKYMTLKNVSDITKHNSLTVLVNFLYQKTILESDRETW